MKRQMINGLILFIVLTFVGQAFAESRERMLGANQSEREIRWAWKYLKEVVSSCLHSTTDCQDAEIRKIVLDLDSYLPAFDSPTAAAWAGSMRFVSESQYPDAFTSEKGEAHRLAITELKRNAPVMINGDRTDIVLGEWIGILGHEVTHHLGFADDDLRTPDRVGAELSKHFLRRVFNSGFEQFNLPETRNLIFNPEGTRLTVGFFSSPEGTFDIEWANSIFTALCQPGEMPVREFVGNPAWSVNYLKPETGLVTLRGGGFVNVMCQRVDGSQQMRRLLLTAVLELQYQAPLNLESWSTETPKPILETLLLGPSLFPADVMWGPNQSYLVKSVEHEKQKLAAGDLWRSKIVVKSSDGAVPPACEVYFSGLHWSYLKHISLPAVVLFPGCAITKLEADRYQLDVSYTLPKDMQGDDFFISLIRFPSPLGDRYAIPHTPNFVHVENPLAHPRAQLTTIAIKGLAAASTMAGTTLTNSYQAKDNQEFQVELMVSGDQDFSNAQVDLPLWSAYNGHVLSVFANGPVVGFPQLVSSVEIVKVAGGSKVILHARLPAVFSGLQIMGMKFARIMLQTSDFSWVEIENKTTTDAVIVNQRYVN